jgi:hypothetical protein
MGAEATRSLLQMMIRMTPNNIMNLIRPPRKLLLVPTPTCDHVMASVGPLSISHTLEHSEMFKSFLSKLVGSKKEKSVDVFFR